MKKFLLALFAVAFVAGCQTNECRNCSRKEDLPCCNQQQVVVRQAPRPAPAPTPVYTAPVVEEVVVPMTKVTTTYKVIEYKKNPECGEYKCSNRYRTEERPVVEYRNKPVRYRNAPKHEHIYIEKKEPQYIERRVVKPVQEPVKLIAPTSTNTYTIVEETENDWVK